MVFRVIDNPDFNKFKADAGFKNHEFKQLAGLYSRAASQKALFDMAVDVNFDEGTCSITYYRTNNYIPYLQFLIRHVGPKTCMYEIFKQDKGRIAKSGLFSRAFQRLEEEVVALMPS